MINFIHRFTVIRLLLGSTLSLSRVLSWWTNNSPVEICQRFRDACCLYHQGKDSWNIGKLLPNYTPQRPRKTAIFNVHLICGYETRSSRSAPYHMNVTSHYFPTFCQYKDSCYSQDRMSGVRFRTGQDFYLPATSRSVSYTVGTGVLAGVWS